MQRLNWEKEMLKAMEENLASQGIQTRLEPGDGQTAPDMLRAQISVFGNDDGIVICEMCFLEFEQEPPVLQIFTTVAVNLSDAGITELEKAAVRLNLYCPIGAFGLFYDNKQLYHKYCAALDDSKQVPEAVDQCEKILEMVFGVIGSQYNLLLALADGQTSCEKAIAQGLMQA